MKPYRITAMLITLVLKKMNMNNVTYTMGIDVGGSYVKGVIMTYDNDSGDHKIVDKQVEKIRKRDPKDVVDDIVAFLLERNNLTNDDLTADAIEETTETDIENSKLKR